MSSIGSVEIKVQVKKELPNCVLPIILWRIRCLRLYKEKFISVSSGSGRRIIDGMKKSLNSELSSGP